MIVKRFEDTKVPRPASEELKLAHPELYAFLRKEKGAKSFKVGTIHLDGTGGTSRQLAESEKSAVKIALTLQDAFRASIIEIAKKMKEDPSSELGQLEFLTGFSRFVTERTVSDYGFEIFEIDEIDKAKYESPSHKNTSKTYKIISKQGEKSTIPTKVRPARIVLISKEALLAFLENQKL